MKYLIVALLLAGCATNGPTDTIDDVLEGDIGGIAGDAFGVGDLTPDAPEPAPEPVAPEPVPPSDAAEVYAANWDQMAREIGWSETIAFMCSFPTAFDYGFGLWEAALDIGWTDEEAIAYSWVAEQHWEETC